MQQIDIKRNRLVSSLFVFLFALLLRFLVQDFDSRERLVIGEMGFAPISLCVLLAPAKAATRRSVQ